MKSGLFGQNPFISRSACAATRLKMSHEFESACEKRCFWSESGPILMNCE